MTKSKKKVYRRKPIERKHKEKYVPPDPIKPPPENSNNRFTILPFPFLKQVY